MNDHNDDLNYEKIFQNLDFEDAIKVYERYLIAKHANNDEVIEEIQQDYPDLFRPNVLFMAKQAFKRVAKLTGNKHYQALIELERIARNKKIDENYWLDRWEKNEIAFNQKEVNDLLLEFFPRDSTIKTVFVPLCGKTLDMLWLQNQGCQVIGCELSELACQQFFHEHKIDYQTIEQENFIVYQAAGITLFCGDVFSLSAEQLPAIDFIYDRAALVALPVDMRDAYIEKLDELLMPEGQMLLITLGYDNERTSAPHCITPTIVDDLYEDYFEITYLGKFSDTTSNQIMKQRDFDNPVEYAFLIKK